jgi:hypothetical protein
MGYTQPFPIPSTGENLLAAAGPNQWYYFLFFLPFASALLSRLAAVYRQFPPPLLHIRHGPQTRPFQTCSCMHDPTGLRVSDSLSIQDYPQFSTGSLRSAPALQFISLSLQLTLAKFGPSSGDHAFWNQVLQAEACGSCP